MEGSLQVLQHGIVFDFYLKKNLIFSQKIDFNLKNANLSVSAVMFCKQFLAYAVHIDGSAFLCYP